MAKSIREISLEDLQVGMVVTKLDIAWINSPFLFHRRLIESTADIDALRKSGCRKVVVEGDFDAPEEASAPSEIPPAEQPPEAKNPVVPLARELQVAHAIQEKFTAAARGVFSAIEGDSPVDVEPMLPLIDKTLASLSRNEQALLTLLQLQRKAERLLDHSFAVFSLTLALSQRLGLGEQEQQQLGVAALLHDTGWLKLPLNLMGKGKPWTDTERKLVSQHPPLAWRCIANGTGLDDTIRRLVAEHEERPDGSGSPTHQDARGLHPLCGILQVADHYDELVHGLMDQPGMTPHAALGHMFRLGKSGTFQGEIIAQLVGLMGVYPIGSAVKLNTGEKALVVGTHKDQPKRPLVKIYYDGKGRPAMKPQELDLAHQGTREPARDIVQVLDPREPGADPAKLLIL